MKEMGVDPETLLDTYIRAINVTTQDRPDDLVISVHMCRGNFMVCSPIWGFIATFMDFDRGRILQTEVTIASPKRFSTTLTLIHFTCVSGIVITPCFLPTIRQLEYDNERSGDFEPLKDFPTNKALVLGLVTTKTGQVSTVRFTRWFPV